MKRIVKIWLSCILTLSCLFSINSVSIIEDLNPPEVLSHEEVNIILDILDTEILKISASDGAAFDRFGSSVSIFNNTIVVGAYGDNIGGNSWQGSAYIFERDQGGPDNWGEITKLTASDGAADDQFGRSVSIYNDMIVVGAPYDIIGGNDNQGSACVFKRDLGGPDNWGEVTKLTASDGEINDRFGWSVSIFNDTIIVGAHYDDVGVNSDQGSAYVFERNFGGPDNWGEVSKLTASDGAAIDRFGNSVSINIDTIIVGAHYDDVGANNDQGSAYLFERDQGGPDNWGEVTKLTVSDGVVDDLFGNSVSVYRDTIVVGARFGNVGTNINQGSAYVFGRDEGGADNWGEVTKLTASDGEQSDTFGDSVSVNRDTIVVGASYDDVGATTDQGSAYVFRRDEGGVDNWGEITKLTASDGAAQDWFANSVSVDYNTTIIGAYADNLGMGNMQGSAYIFNISSRNYKLPLNEGWNLISLPFKQPDTSIDKVLSSITGKWDYIQAYNSTDPNHWKTNATFKPDQLNSLKFINHTMGFWINITEPDVKLHLYGNESSSTSIHLYAGWNLVGYPSLVEKSISDSLAATGYDRPVEGLNSSAPYRISQLADTYIMKPGEGYWVHVPADTSWVVDW